MIRLSEAAGPIREALARLAESPRELRCYVIIEDAIIGRFVQFCTPPPPSKFADSPRLVGPEPLIYDGTGLRDKNAYEPAGQFCDVDLGVALALGVLARYLPREAELRIVEESTRLTQPS